MRISKYKTADGFVHAIRRLELTPPAKPLKGRGFERVGCRHVEMLSAVLGKEVRFCKHLVTIYGRARGKWGHCDAEDAISPELDRLLRANEELVKALAEAYSGKLTWDHATRKR